MSANLHTQKEDSLPRVISRLIARRVYWLLGCNIAASFASVWWFFDLFTHFRWQYLLAALLFLMPAIYAKQRREIGFACLIALWNLAWILQASYGAERGSFVPKQQLSMLFANLAMNDDVTPLINVVHRLKPDAIGVAELSPLAQIRLVELLPDYSVHAMRGEPSWRGIGVLLRADFAACAHRNAQIEDAEFPSAELSCDDFRISVIHPIPPIAPSAAAMRDGYLHALIGKLQAHPKQHHFVVGDFNASPWSFPYRKLKTEAGAVDSLQGQIPWPTWHGWNWLFAPLSVPIDQALVRPAAGSKVRVLERAVLANPGSDHSMVFARWAW
jgi:endonuclease/exonuclease/phosphatase (EEP) superfamily protein YafD